MCALWFELSSFPFEQSGKVNRTPSTLLVHRFGAEFESFRRPHLHLMCSPGLVIIFSPASKGFTFLWSLPPAR